MIRKLAYKQVYMYIHVFKQIFRNIPYGVLSINLGKRFHEFY